MRHARALLTAIISVSLVASSAAAAASSTPAPQPAQPDAWMALSILTPSGVDAMGSVGAMAAQPDAPMPPPPPPAYRDSSDTTLIFFGSVLVLAVLAALAVSHGGHDHNQAISPN